MLKFYNQSLITIIDILSTKLSQIEEKAVLEFEVLNPDYFQDIYSGTIVTIEENHYIYRSLNTWNDLAQKLFCKMLMPKVIDEKSIIIRYQKLNLKKSFHNNEKNSEKYGLNSEYNNINKSEEPEFLINYINALNNVKTEGKKRVLNLGINSGNEFEIIKKVFKEFSNIEFVGIDYCQSAINSAKDIFKNDKNVKLYCHDINDLETLDLGNFDLIISIGTLQSTNLNFNEVFMNIVQNYLSKDGAMILGFPNCRWIDTEIIYGAKAPNYSYSEMSILFKDVMFCKKYLQQKKFRVTITGKYYIFLTATSIRK
jgi:hypothetical protein